MGTRALVATGASPERQGKLGPAPAHDIKYLCGDGLRLSQDASPWASGRPGKENNSRMAKASHGYRYWARLG